MAVGVLALLNSLFSEERGYRNDVFGKALNVGENLVVYLLEDVFAVVIALKKIGFVDVTASVAFTFYGIAGDFKEFCGSSEFVCHFTHLRI